jgi:hypothetical protein
MALVSANAAVLIKLNMARAKGVRVVLSMLHAPRLVMLLLNDNNYQWHL